MVRSRPLKNRTLSGKEKLPATFIHFEIYCILCQIANRFQCIRLKAPKMSLTAKLQRTVDCRKRIKSNPTTTVFHLPFVANFKLARSPLLIVLHFIWIGDWRLSYPMQFPWTQVCWLYSTRVKETRSNSQGFPHANSNKTDLIEH